MPSPRPASACALIRHTAEHLSEQREPAAICSNVANESACTTSEVVSISARTTASPSGSRPA